MILIKQLTALSLERRTLLHENTEEHPFVHEVDEKAKALLVEKKRLEKKLTSLPASDQIAVGLMRDIKVKHELYLALLKQIQEFKVEEASTISDVQILSLAKVPHAPVSKHSVLTWLASAAFGFALSCVIIFIRKTLFPKVNDPHWVEQHLGLANVCIIPYSLRQKFFSGTKLLAREYVDDLALEALRSLRTSLQVLLCHASNNIVSIVGLSPGIGKSFVSANLLIC